MYPKHCEQLGDKVMVCHLLYLTVLSIVQESRIQGIAISTPVCYMHDDDKNALMKEITFLWNRMMIV